MSRGDSYASRPLTALHPSFEVQILSRRDLKTLQEFPTIFYSFANIFAHSSKTSTPKILEETADEDFGNVAVS